MPLLSKAEIVRRLTNFHEQEVVSIYLQGTVLLRELTAAQRLQLQEASQGAAEDGTPIPDYYTPRAMELQMMIVDPASGVPYADGRIDPATGQPRIDPRTRVPLFTPDETADLLNGREGAVNELIAAGRALSRLHPDDFHSGTASPNAAQRDTGAGVETRPADRGADAAGQDRALDLGAAHDDQAVGDDGDTVGGVAESPVE